MNFSQDATFPILIEIKVLKIIVVEKLVKFISHSLIGDWIALNLPILKPVCGRVYSIILYLSNLKFGQNSCSWLFGGNPAWLNVVALKLPPDWWQHSNTAWGSFLYTCEYLLSPGSTTSIPIKLCSIPLVPTLNKLIFLHILKVKTTEIVICHVKTRQRVV